MGGCGGRQGDLEGEKGAGGRARGSQVLEGLGRCSIGACRWMGRGRQETEPPCTDSGMSPRGAGRGTEAWGRIGSRRGVGEVSGPGSRACAVFSQLCPEIRSGWHLAPPGPLTPAVLLPSRRPPAFPPEAAVPPPRPPPPMPLPLTAAPQPGLSPTCRSPIEPTPKL